MCMQHEIVGGTLKKGDAGMTNQETNETIGASATSSAPVLSIEEVRQLEIVRIKSVREGKVPSCTYNFRPSTCNVPDDFLAVDGISWAPCNEEKVSRTIRNWVQHLREEGDLVDVSSAPGGIVCFHLNFRGERIALWFNAWTSTTVVIGSDGKVRRPLSAKEGDSNS